jgi:N-acetylglucosaminyldiphosphoundecaprenol N-acetyl-beta-D-mannosaminyltransferase
MRDIRIYSVFPQKISGSDIIYPILDIAHTKKLRVYLLGGSQQVSESVKEYIMKTYPRIVISGSNTQKITYQNTEIFQDILDTHSDIVLIALSYPLQEIWSSKLKQYFIKHNHKGILFCIGGTFDFIAGVQRRAPTWLQNIGLEWIYRLLQQPSRIKRIYKAVVQYMFLMHQYKKHQPR